jgi:hypothetical protein
MLCNYKCNTYTKTLQRALNNLFNATKNPVAKKPIPQFIHVIF